MNQGPTGRAVAMLSAAMIGALTLGAAGTAIAQQETVVDEPAATRTLGRIDWPEARRDAAEAGVQNLAPGGGLATFEGSGRRSADNLQVPVLLPQSLIDANELNQLDEPMELLARTNDYSAEAKIAPRSYLITGTRVIFEAPAEATTEIEPVPELFVERSDYGIQASFERYGAVYTIEIFCPLPTADEECRDDDRIRALAEEMTFVP